MVWLVWSPCFPRDSQESSPEPQFENISSSALSLLYGPTLTSIHGHWMVWCACPVAQSCLTVSDPMDCSPPGFSVHGIFQARILEWVAISCSKSWTTKKTEHWRSDAFESWFWRRFLRVPWKARRSHQSNHFLKEINPEYSLEGLMLKLKRQYFCHLMQRADSLEKTLMLGKTKQEKRATKGKRVGWHHWINEHEFEQTPGDNEG